MILGIGREAAIFAEALLAGFFVWGVYTVLRIFRRIVRHGIGLIALEDGFYWIFVSIFLFMEMYRTCDGSIRWYFVLGVAAGAAIGAWTASLLGRGCRILRDDFQEKRGKSIDKSGKRR